MKASTRTKATPISRHTQLLRQTRRPQPHLLPAADQMHMTQAGEAMLGASRQSSRAWHLLSALPQRTDASPGAPGLRRRKRCMRARCATPISRCCRNPSFTSHSAHDARQLLRRWQQSAEYSLKEHKRLPSRSTRHMQQQLWRQQRAQRGGRDHEPSPWRSASHMRQQLWRQQRAQRGILSAPAAPHQLRQVLHRILQRPARGSLVS